MIDSSKLVTVWAPDHYISTPITACYTQFMWPSANNEHKTFMGIGYLLAYQCYYPLYSSAKKQHLIFVEFFFLFNQDLTLL